MSYGGSLYYKVGVGEGDFAFAPFASYLIGSYDSSANSATRTETFKERTMGLGLKFYFGGNTFLKLNYAWTNAKNESTSTTTQTLSDDSTGIGGGIGFAFSLSNYVKLEISADVENVNFKSNPASGTQFGFEDQPCSQINVF
jgi:hypothetical protein